MVRAMVRHINDVVTRQTSRTRRDAWILLLKLHLFFFPFCVDGAGELLQLVVLIVCQVSIVIVRVVQVFVILVVAVALEDVVGEDTVRDC